MRSRSNRLPPSDPPDDWGDGSWTVDCSCGVTFDDGEEMVSCDECGVWVHTRCSRFIRGETSFACHNCNKAPNPSLAEETEVAQLLVELPTCPPPPPALPPPHLPAAPTHRPPFRLWAEVPLEDRVHVQGLPGGDPALFRGIAPSVFTSELWKCAGYVPKKFNFQYREFSCWDEDGGGENPASRGANVLFSLSKEVVPVPVPVPPRGMERRQEERKVNHHQLQGWGKKERNRLRAIGPHSSSKRRREEPTAGKKKIREDGDLRTRVDSPAAADVNRVGLDESIGEVQNKDNSSVANGEGTESDGKLKQPCTVGSTEEGLKLNASSETTVKVKADENNNGYFLKLNDSNLNQEGNSALVNESTEEEDVNKAAYGLRQPKDESHYEGDLNGGSCHVVIDKEEPRAVVDYPSVPGMHDLPDSDGHMSLSSKLQEVEVKICMADAQGFEKTKSLACPASDEIPNSANQLPHRHQKSSAHSSEILLEYQAVTSLSSNEHKSRDSEKEVVFSNQVYDKTTEGKETGVSERKQHGQVVEESPSSATAEESSFEATHVSKIVGEPTKCEDSNLCVVSPSLHKAVVTADKASSTSLVPVISRPSVSGCSKALVSTASSIDGKATQLSKQRAKVTSLTSSKKDVAATVSSTEESIREVSRHPVKGHSKSLDYNGPKSSQSSRIAHSSDSKHAISDSKEPLLGPSSKSSTAMNITTVAVSVEVVGSSPTQNASIQLSTGSCLKSEKLSQPLPHPQSKLLNNSSSIHPPPCATATTLSDEELALLLHQELNSSPRVPRVPRMRQATGLQLVSPTAPSMLSKRSSSHSGAKDQVFRRKNKEEAPKDISRNSHKVNETKRVGRASTSPDQKYRESAFLTDGSSKKDIRKRSPDSGVSLRKNISRVAYDEGETRSDPSFEATGHNTLSKKSSPRDLVNSGTSAVPRTLPVLLDEIISKGNCSTYEELCDAVRPHWNNLRKPNGDRYAYSSHSHAVLDCLRNRCEWAHLIDRGPKTNSSKRRRKVDSETPGLEESEYEDEKKPSSKEVVDINGESHREEFPRGKRNVRKRRRLELRCQDMEEARKRKRSSSQSAPVVSDGDNNDDPAAGFSHSSSGADEVDGLSSEESHGGGDFAAGEELSTSSSSGDTDDS